MKVVISGSHGTGKSSILAVLKGQLKNYMVQTDSITRSAVSDSSKVNFGTSEETQTQIMDKWVEVMSKAPANYITSRHCIDYLAYSIYFAKVNGNISKEFIRSQSKIVEQHLKEFDLVFYLPIMFKQKEGGLYRQGQIEHPEYQYEHDLILKFLFWDFGVKYVTILEKTVQGRAAQVLQEIRKRELNERN